MKVIFEKNSYLFGALAWLFAVVLGYGAVLLFKQIPPIEGVFNNPKTEYLIALMPALLLIRFFLVNKKWERSGGAVVGLTFLAGILIFMLVK